MFEAVKRRLHTYWPGIILVSLLAINILFFYLSRGQNLEKTIGFLMNFTPTNVREYVLGFGIFAPIILMLLIIGQNMIAPIPGHVFLLTAGALYGSFWGSALTITSNIIGSALCFKLAEHFGRPLVEKLVPKEDLDAVHNFMQAKKGFFTLAIIRMNPIMGFDVISYVCGLTKMSFWKYMIATTIGIIPGSIIYSSMGSQLMNGQVIWFFVMSFVLVAIIFGAPILIERIKE